MLSLQNKSLNLRCWVCKISNKTLNLQSASNWIPIQFDCHSNGWTYHSFFSNSCEVKKKSFFLKIVFACNRINSPNIQSTSKQYCTLILRNSQASRIIVAATITWSTMGQIGPVSHFTHYLTIGKGVRS